jgi:hypothetical protein
MGENRVGGESILGELIEEDVYRVENDHLSIMQNTAYLHNFYLDKLKYVHIEPFGYNKCKFGFINIIALIIKCTNGEKKYA